MTNPTPNPIAAWLAANAAEPRYGAARYRIAAVLNSNYYALLDGDQELSDTDAAARLNEQEKTIAELRAALDHTEHEARALDALHTQACVERDALRLALDDAHQHVGALLSNTDDDLAHYAAQDAARTWLRRRG